MHDNTKCYYIACHHPKAPHDHSKCCDYLWCPHPQCCGYYGRARKIRWVKRL